MRTNSNHELGIQAAMKHGIVFQDAIPVDLWRCRPGPLADFIKREWLEWEREVGEKVSQERELESWLKTLNAPSSGPKTA